MARKNVTARAERIVRFLPTIAGLMARWHDDRLPPPIAESGGASRSVREARTSGGEGARLTFTQYQALTAIREVGECSVNDLSRKLDIAQSTTSQLVDRLVKGGFIVRQSVEEDRRRTVVTLSKWGSQTMKQGRRSLLDVYKNVLQKLDESDQEILEDAAEKLYRITMKLNESSNKRAAV